MQATEALPNTPQRVLVLGATGTIGQATVRALQRLGHTVVCVVRARAGVGGALSLSDCQRLLPGAQLRLADVMDAASLLRDAVCGEHFDAVVSCLASRTGAPQDAWAIDHQAQLHALEAARQAGAGLGCHRHHRAGHGASLAAPGPYGGLRGACTRRRRWRFVSV